MPRIIRPGNPRMALPFWRRQTWECKRCGAEWELTDQDKPPYVYDGDQREPEKFAQMDCPTCKANTYLYERREQIRSYAASADAEMYYNK